MIDAKVFHNKTIDIYRLGKYKDDDGVTRKGYTKVFDSVVCNVQPITSERAREQYGYDISCTKRVFIDYENLAESNIKESDIILYKGKTYNVQQIIEWNTYVILLILEKVVEVNE